MRFSKKSRKKEHQTTSQRYKLFQFIRWVMIDIGRYAKTGRKRFREFGLTMYCGRQGGGKTISAVEYLERMKLKYPKVEIYTNFGYTRQDKPLTGWKMLIEKRSNNGVIFVIDEIHSEFSSNTWKNFPPSLLREISQQRKQRVKIVATAQAFKDVAVQLRRQCFDVVECRTVQERWTFQRCFDAEDYNCFVESNATSEKKFKIRRKYRRSFVQTDELRELFNTWEKIEAIQKVGFSSSSLEEPEA